MYILGVSCFYHDSSAALLKDGVVVAAAEEERFTRKKHDTSFPINAIKYCLKSQNITIEDTAYVGFYEKPFLKFESPLLFLIHFFLIFPGRSLMNWIDTRPWLSSSIRTIL